MAAVGEHRVERQKPGLGQVVVEVVPADRSAIGPTASAGRPRELDLELRELSSRGGSAGRESTPEHLRSHPCRNILHGRSRADRKPSARHAAEHGLPALHPFLCARSCRLVFVRQRGDERARHLPEGVAPPDLDLVVLIHQPAWRVLPPRPPGPEPGALLLSYTLSGRKLEALSPGGAGQAPPLGMGFSHLTSVKRAKSVSAEQRVSPCSMASAASWASGTRLPRTSWRTINSPRIAAYRSPGWGIQTTSAPSQSVTRAQASRGCSGRS